MAATTRTCMLSATEKEAALRRIGFYRCSGSGADPKADDWNILNWFVRLAQGRMPIPEMAESEVELLRQEYRALQEVTSRLNQNVVTIKALEEFQSMVRRHLEDLADLGRTTFGPFTLTRSVSMPRWDDPSQTPRAHKVMSGANVEPFGGQGLLYLLSCLCDRVGLSVLRCPHCAQVFLQTRRDAESCSRRCQANAYAQSKREAAKAKQTHTKKLSSKKRNQTAKKAAKARWKSS